MKKSYDLTHYEHELQFVLVNRNISNQTIYNKNFSDNFFHPVDFSNCVFANTQFQCTECEDLTFENCQFLFTEFQSSDLGDFNFINCKFNSTYLTVVEFVDVRVDNSQLHDVGFFIGLLYNVKIQLQKKQPLTIQKFMKQFMMRMVSALQRILYQLRIMLVF